MNLLVVGAGSMGQWLARALAEDAPRPVEPVFLDASQQAAREAAESVEGRAVEPATNERFDAVCIAVPIPAAKAAIERYGPLADEAVFDVTGTMTEPLQAMERHVPNLARASYHPLFAPANEPGNVPVAVASRGAAIDVVNSTLDTRGNAVFETTAAEHDQAMETVQARTHAAILAFALASEEVPEGFHTPVSAALSDLAHQVTSGEARVYADIQAAFDGAADVAEAAAALAAADDEEFERLYEEAR